MNDVGPGNRSLLRHLEDVVARGLRSRPCNRRYRWIPVPESMQKVLPESTSGVTEESVSRVPEPNQAAPMGSFVRVHLPQILARCRADPEEFANLQDKTYCLANFRQSYRFLMSKGSAARSGDF